VGYPRLRSEDRPEASREQMYTEDLIAKQREWAERGLMSARKLLPLMAPVSTYPGWTREERETITYLASATARASESALLLCAYGQLWDAEVLVRSTLEGSLKFSYLLQSPMAFVARHREYAKELFGIALLKDHRKAADLLATVQNPEDDEWRPLRDRLLSNAELTELSARFGRGARRELETRWGFTGLIGALSRSGDPLFQTIGGMAHGYSLASHVQHVDMVGASIPLDRDRRAPERRESLHLAHQGRLVSDILILLYLRLTVGYRFVGADITPLVEAKALVDAAGEWQDDAYRAWMDVEYRKPASI